MGQTLVSSNVLLAEFMGWAGKETLVYKSIDGGQPRRTHVFETSFGKFAKESLKFNEDWNWLMAVVEKLSEDKYFEYRIERDWVNFKFPMYMGTYFVGKGKNRYRNTQECLFKACVDFVQWLKNKLHYHE